MAAEHALNTSGISISPKPAKTALVAEDNATTRRCLADNLTALGYDNIIMVSNGEEAVEAAEKQSVDLVIMDYKMPKLDGISAAKIISSRTSAPIILITGHSDENIAQSAIDAGIVAYLVKPVTKKHLFPAIKLAEAKHIELSSLKAEVKDLRESIETRKLVERAKGILMKRCSIGEDEAFKLLQSHSQKENKKMKEIAAMIIDASKLL